MITQYRLKELLSYNSDTGVFTCLVDRGPVKKGSIVDGRDRQGYARVMLDGKRYGAHRLAWLYINGNFPDGEIDHVNHIRNDNRISNLRDVTLQQNQMNRLLQGNNKSGCSGVNWAKASNKWVARIHGNGKRLILGYFKSLEEAISVRKAAEVKYNYHANHGKP